MKLRNRSLVALALTALLAIAITAPLGAAASEEGRRNTTLGLGAASAALLLTQRNKLPGILVGAGAVYSYSQYLRDINHRHAHERAASYRTGFRRGQRYARYYRRRR